MMATAADAVSENVGNGVPTTCIVCLGMAGSGKTTFVQV